MTVRDDGKEQALALPDAVSTWMMLAADAGEELTLWLKAEAPTYRRDILLAATLRLLEKCREGIAELEKAFPV